MYFLTQDFQKNSGIFQNPGSISGLKELSGDGEDPNQMSFF